MRVLISPVLVIVRLFFFFFFFRFYLFGCIRSQLWHVESLLHHAGSFVVALGLSYPVSCGILVPWPEMNLSLLHNKVDS